MKGGLWIHLEGIKEGIRHEAPQAVQVVDRLHLVQNLRDALERLSPPLSAGPQHPGYFMESTLQLNPAYAALAGGLTDASYWTRSMLAHNISAKSGRYSMAAFPREALPDDWHLPEEIVIFLSSGYYVLLYNHFLNFNVQPLTGWL